MVAIARWVRTMDIVLRIMHPNASGRLPLLVSRSSTGREQQRKNPTLILGIPSCVGDETEVTKLQLVLILLG